MKIHKIYLFITLLFFLSMCTLSAQQGNEHVNVVAINHDCGEKGIIELDLLNEDEIQNYYWEHGPTDLTLNNLEPGIYTFVVVKKTGCIVKTEVEILEVKECTWKAKIKKDGDCKVTVIIEALINDIPVGENALDITWNDGGSGLVRSVRQDHTFEYCVEIKPAGGNEDCCYFEECFLLKEEKGCTKRKEVIVNEFSVNHKGKQQYVELLVVGNGECEKTFDLRGFHLDDNNGLLIPANDFVTGSTLETIGVTEGYLTFNHDKNWEEVPNGSLILIVKERGGSDPNMPELDPTDANDDSVYVVSADNTQFLSGKLGTWDEDMRKMMYDGTFTNPTWEKLLLDENADGMQVRYPTGEYCHGISRGATSFAAENNFELWITSENTGTGNCRFVLEDELQKEHFVCNEAQDSLQSPGKTNSPENAALRASLLDCSISDLPGFVSDGSGEEGTSERADDSIDNNNDSFKVYPNPFQDELHLEFKTEKIGEAMITMFTPSGQRNKIYLLDCEKGLNKHKLKFSRESASGLYILRLIYPSGKQEYRKVIQAF